MAFFFGDDGMLTSESSDPAEEATDADVLRKGGHNAKKKTGMSAEREPFRTR